MVGGDDLLGKGALADLASPEPKELQNARNVKDDKEGETRRIWD